MKKVNFVQQTDAALYKFLKHYCLEVPENEKGQLIRGEAQKILTDYQNMLMTEEDRRVKVVFHKTGDPTQGEYVFIGHNGRGYQIPFDQEVVLPESVVRVCDDAVITTFKQSAKSSMGEIVHDSFEHKLYPYTIIAFMDLEAKMTTGDEDLDAKISKKK